MVFIVDGMGPQQMALGRTLKGKPAVRGRDPVELSVDPDRDPDRLS
jgi:hypothetical protein